MQYHAIRLLLVMSGLFLAVVTARALNIPDEAHRYMNRGYAAVEMAQSDADLSGAIKEFEKAAKLAPDWPDPYYNLGMVQNKLGRLDDAITNLTRYLKLAPQAQDTAAVRRLVDKLSYKKDKENEVKKAFELIGSGRTDFKLLSQNDRGPMKMSAGFASRFRMNGGGLETRNPWWTPPHGDRPSPYKDNPGIIMSRQEDWREWVPVTVNGRSFEYVYVYPMWGYNRDQAGIFLYENRGKGEIISLDPLQTREVATLKTILFAPDRGDTWSIINGIASTTEYVAEVRAK